MSTNNFPYIIKLQNITKGEYNLMSGGRDTTILNMPVVNDINYNNIKKNNAIINTGNYGTSALKIEYAVTKEIDPNNLYTFIIETLYNKLYKTNKKNGSHYDKYIDYITKMIPYHAKYGVWVSDVDNITDIYVPIYQRYIYDFDLDIINDKITEITADNEFMYSEKHYMLLPFNEKYFIESRKSWFYNEPANYIYKQIVKENEFLYKNRVPEVFFTKNEKDSFEYTEDKVNDSCIIS